MSLTITEPLERVPTFAELQALGRQHHVQINGDHLTGEFCHPDAGQPKVTGHYTIASNIHGHFTAHVMGTVAGTFELAAGKAEVTVTEKPFLLPDALLKSTLAKALKDFCSQFSTAPQGD